MDVLMAMHVHNAEFSPFAASISSTQVEAALVRLTRDSLRASTF